MKDKRHIPQIVWHHSAHQRWAQESLHYVRLGFSPVYQKIKTLESLDNYLKDRGITSYGRYEVFGSIDILLRLWLKKELNVATLCQELRSSLSDCTLIDVFSVSDTCYHWLWKDPNNPGKMLAPELNKYPPIGLIEATNKFCLDDKLLEQQINGNLIRKYSPCRGVMFFTFIPQFSGGYKAVKTITSEIVKDYWNSSAIRDLAVYEGIGLYSVLIKGVVRYSNYDKLSLKLLDHINNIGLYQQVKTETLLVTGDSCDSFHQREYLAVPRNATIAEHSKRSIDYYLSCDEDESLEIKASIDTPFTRVLLGDGKSDSTPKLAEDGVLKAVASLLNTNGGEVILGMFETSKIPQDKLSSIYNQYPHSDKYIVVGIESENNFKDWDKYKLRLVDLINSHIRCDVPIGPMEWISIERLSLEQSGLTKSIAIVRIQQTPPDILFKIDGKYFKREDNKNAQIEGEYIYHYKKTRSMKRDKEQYNQ
jgi:hypothetical protein